MFISYNFSIMDERDWRIPVGDRAFRYGDGLFETILYNNGQIQRLTDHIRRLKRGMKALGFEGISGIMEEVVHYQILNVVRKNGIENQPVRVRLQVWRKPGGFYMPENLHFNLLITAVPLNPLLIAQRHIRVAFANSVRLCHTSFSKYKTLNAMPYVVAGIERSKSGYDDLILLDQHGHISECTASNIFWVKDNKIKTPKLDAGCVLGVGRRNMIEWLKQKGYSVKKVMEKKDKILEADHIFTTNVFGVNHIVAVENKVFTPFGLLEKFFPSAS